MQLDRSHPLRILEFFTFSLLFLAVGYGQAPSGGLLDHLEGGWEMTGTVMKKPGRYSAEGVWILRNQFLSFHMKDAAVPPAYEATLFLGIDSAKNQYIAHWLDSFGGAGARVVGMGPFSTEKIEIVYPYSEGKFRNLFTYDATVDEWRLTIESERSKGHWSPFAQYTIIRKR
jgi:hypothetical protein